MTRIISQTGNVISADFKPRASLTVTIKTEMLYSDERIMLTRTSATMSGHDPLILHLLGCIATGKITTF